MQQLLERNNEDSRKAVETGRISDQFMIAADDRELADGTALLLNDGSSEARFMAAGSATTSRNSPKGRPLDPCLLAVNGSQPIFPRVGQPAQLRPFNLEDDPGFRYLQPMFGNLLQTDWTMFDLRPLRQQFNRAGAMTADLAASFSATTSLVLVPEGRPSTEIR